MKHHPLLFIHPKWSFIKEYWQADEKSFFKKSYFSKNIFQVIKYPWVHLISFVFCRLIFSSIFSFPMICSSTKSSQIKGCAQHPQKATLSLVIPRCICDVSQRFPSTAAFPAFALFGWKAGRYFSKVGNGRVECSRLEKITCCSRSQTGVVQGPFLVFMWFLCQLCSHSLRQLHHKCPLF